MEMIEVKTAELSGPALDWAVAKTEGADPMLLPISRNGYEVVVLKNALPSGEVAGKTCRYSTDWYQCGPLIEQNGVDLSAPPFENRSLGWDARLDDGESSWVRGETPLIAACRAIVAANLGDTVLVPAALTGGDA